METAEGLFMKVISTLILTLLPAVAAAEVKSPIGRKIEDFKLHDYRGAERALHEFAEAKAVVVVFLGTSCPVAKLYAPRLAELADAYQAKGIAFLGINANHQDSLADITRQAKEAGITFPILKDPTAAVADRFGATHVPEVFVLDKDRIVRYRGRIDDQYGVGYARPKPTVRDLATALDELLADKPVTTPETEVQGCFIGRVQRGNEQAEVTYSKHIAPIFQRRCVECHQPGEVAPFPLTNYEEVVGWAETIRWVVKKERMPPWHADTKPGQFSNDARLSEQEKQLIYRWVQLGAPEGDPKDLPPPLERTEGWRIPKPDIIISMPKPYHVPATGTVRYQYFVVDPGFTEDKWVSAAEIRPGNRAVVHHTIVHAQPPTDRPQFTNGLASHWLAAQAPGSRPTILPEGYAKRIPAGSRILFQMHYTPNGAATTDQTCIALTFCDPKTVKKEVTTEMVANTKFIIPPHAEKHVVEANFTVKEDMMILAYMPHTHLRGSYFRYEARYPDGREELLLDVPRYDFNWQNTYVLAEPKVLPKGTVIHCVAHYNNSRSNLSNPDPTKAVRWGDQTWEEMMIGYMETVPVHQDLSKNLPKTVVSQEPPIDQALKESASKAMLSREAFDTFATTVKRAYPKVDRVCVTKVDDDKLKVVRASYPGDSQQQFGQEGFEAPLRVCMLGFTAMTNWYRIIPDLSREKGGDLNMMHQKVGLSSSLHIPVALDGSPANVSFWSKTKDAFSPAELDIFRALAKALVTQK